MPKDNQGNEIEMCQHKGCVLAAIHVDRGKPHATRRVSMMARARTMCLIKLRRTKTATPQEVRASLQSYVDYWENRLEKGDLLLDQWMWDAYQAAKDAVAAVDRIGAAVGIDLT